MRIRKKGRIRRGKRRSRSLTKTSRVGKQGSRQQTQTLPVRPVQQHKVSQQKAVIGSKTSTFSQLQLQQVFVLFTLHYLTLRYTVTFYHCYQQQQHQTTTCIIVPDALSQTMTSLWFQNLMLPRLLWFYLYLLRRRFTTPTCLIMFQV